MISLKIACHKCVTSVGQGWAIPRRMQEPVNIVLGLAVKQLIDGLIPSAGTYQSANVDLVKEARTQPGAIPVT